MGWHLATSGFIDAPAPCGSTMLNRPWEKTREQAIHEASSALLRAVNTSDLEAVMAIWDDSGILMPPGHSSVQGHQAIRAYFEQLFEGSRFQFVFTSSQVSVDGASAVERALCTRPPLGPSKQAARTGTGARVSTSIAGKRAAHGR